MYEAGAILQAFSVAIFVVIEIEPVWKLFR
jgi:hypothetical protein